MRVLVATDFLLMSYGNSLYLKDTNKNTLERYKKAFGEVCLCTRFIKDGDPAGFVSADDIVDSYVPLNSLSEALLHKSDSAIREAIRKSDLVVARVPSIIAYRAAELAKEEKKPVFSVAIGCAWDAYWNHSLKGKLIAPYMYANMRKTMTDAQYALYVTNEFLQKRYPAKCRSIGVSDVKIAEPTDTLLDVRFGKINNMDKQSITLMTSGSVGARSKGQRYMIEAIPLLNKKGIRVRYLLAGADDQTYLRGIAKANGVEDQVVFLGMLRAQEVFENLDATDIYVQPSLQEGLPRAVVEAMSRGCPVIGARTGGIPELIDSGYVVKRKSPGELSDAILRLLNDNNMTIEAKRNFEKAKLFADVSLAHKRSAYYAYIQNHVENGKYS